MRSHEGRNLTLTVVFQHPAGGQALVELLVAIPFLALLAGMALGTLRYAMLGHWADERLESRLLRPHEPSCEGAAVSLRRESAFPSYLTDDEVRFSHADPSRRNALGPLHRILDGGMAVQEAVLQAGQDPAMRRMPAAGPAFAGTTVRRLGWWRCSWPGEGEVRGRVERVLLAGLPGHGLIEWIRRAGMEPIRVDPDVLPPSARRAEETNGSAP